MTSSVRVQYSLLALSTPRWGPRLRATFARLYSIFVYGLSFLSSSFGFRITGKIPNLLKIDVDRRHVSDPLCQNGLQDIA